MQEPQAVFLDFDGVVLESLDVKTEAMAALFADHPEHVDAIVRYHVENAGVNRYEKFKYFYANFFKKVLPEPEMARLDKKFGELIWTRMVEVPFVPGAREFIERWGSRLPMFVISAAPQREVDAIVEQRGLKTFFRSVHGSPTLKTEHLARLLKKHGFDPARCLFVGDGKADFEAARDCGVPFVQRLTRHAPRPFGPCVAALDDLRTLDALWKQPAFFWLARAGERPARASLKSKGGPWVYFGRDYRAMKRWERNLGPGFRRIDISTALQKTAGTLRKPYLTFLADLGRRHSSLEWWSSQIAEENTLSGGLFSEVCAAQLASDLLNASPRPVLIVAENPGVLETLIASGGRYVDPLARVKTALSWRALFVRRWCAYAARSLRAVLTARKGAPLALGERVALLHACIGPGFFSDDGPRDTYLSALPQELRRLGYRVVWLAWLYNPGRSRRSALAWMRRRQEEFIIADDFLSAADYLWAARVVIRQRWLPSLPQNFAGMDITPLVEEARRRQAANASAAPFVLYYRLFERLASAGFSPELFIDPSEGSLIERPPLLGLHQFSPRTRTVGYQHVTTPPLFLQNFTAAAPASLSPLPDVIVCNSPLTREVLAREGYAESKLRIGPSLRHLSLLGPVRPGRPEPRLALVVFSLDPAGSGELFDMLREAFAKDEGIRFALKPHPNMPKAQWREIIGKRGLPDHMHVADGPLSDWIAQAACAISGASTGAIDLALSGIPLVIAGRATVIDFNPLSLFPEKEPPVRSASELRSQVSRALSLSEDQRRALAQWAEQAKQRLLSPVTPATIAAFVDPPSVSAAYDEKLTSRRT